MVARIWKANDAEIFTHLNPFTLTSAAIHGSYRMNTDENCNYVVNSPESAIEGQGAANPHAVSTPGVRRREVIVDHHTAA